MAIYTKRHGRKDERMKLIIDIPKEAYKQIMEFGFLENTHGKICYKAIKNGTPIDDDSLLAALMLFAMDNVTPQSKAQIKEKLLQILDRKGEQDGN